MPAGGAEEVGCGAGAAVIVGWLAGVVVVGCVRSCCCTEGGIDCHASDGMPAGGAEEVAGCGAGAAVVVGCGVGAGVGTGVAVGCGAGVAAGAGAVGCVWICCCTEGGIECHASDGMPAGGAVTTGGGGRGGSYRSTWRPPVLPVPVAPPEEDVLVAGLGVVVDVVGRGKDGRMPPPPPSLMIMGPPSWGFSGFW
jgi:hypothetical protein